MKVKPRRSTLTPGVLLLFFAILFFPACSPKIAEEIRRHTYPPKFDYSTSEELRSTMWRFAAQVKQLDDVMQKPELPAEDRRREAIRILSEMERVSMDLGTGWPGNHPEVSRNIVVFRRDLTAARHALEMDPPLYYLAGTISGACSHCHSAR
jgi:hypothetical protein